MSADLATLDPSSYVAQPNSIYLLGSFEWCVATEPLACVQCAKALAPSTAFLAMDSAQPTGTCALEGCGCEGRAGVFVKGEGHRLPADAKVGAWCDEDCVFAWAFANETGQCWCLDLNADGFPDDSGETPTCQDPEHARGDIEDSVSNRLPFAMADELLALFQDLTDEKGSAQ